MAHQVFLSKTAPVLEIQYVGKVSPADLNDSIAQVLSLTHSRHCSRVLTDCSQLNGGHSLIDLFAAVKNISQQRPPAGYREAILLPQSPAMRQLGHFWETVCQNRGLNVKSFSDRESALTWLQS